MQYECMIFFYLGVQMEIFLKKDALLITYSLKLCPN